MPAELPRLFLPLALRPADRGEGVAAMGAAEVTTGEAMLRVMRLNGDCRVSMDMDTGDCRDKGLSRLFLLLRLGLLAVAGDAALGCTYAGLAALALLVFLRLGEGCEFGDAGAVSLCLLESSSSAAAYWNVDTCMHQ